METLRTNLYGKYPPKEIHPESLCIDSTHIEDMQRCMTAQRYAAPDKNYSAIKPWQKIMQKLKTDQTFQEE
ncbi:hypothetical protein TNCV_3719861 [Trichonephila clavipes]|nr:hypothetical protein TNCV_3719861 [Trichonephila clavipes]